MHISLIFHKNPVGEASFSRDSSLSPLRMEEKVKKFARMPVLALLIVLPVLFNACGDKDDPAGIPATGSVAGTVTFLGEWPSSGDIQISIYSTLSPPWVPMGPPDAFTDPIQGSPAQYQYKLDGLDKATYAAIYVSWRDPQNPAASKLLGMYWASPESAGIDEQSGLPVEQPASVTINDANLNHSNLNITADLDMVP